MLPFLCHALMLTSSVQGQRALLVRLQRIAGQRASEIAPLVFQSRRKIATICVICVGACVCLLGVAMFNKWHDASTMLLASR